MARSIRIGLVGCGVVGTGILRLLQDHAAMIRGRLGATIDVRHVLVQNQDKPRDPIVPRSLITADPRKLLDDPELDIVVEVMGGLEPAGPILKAALERGKHIVTANKALLAERGDDLLELAHSRALDLYFEGAVGGGIPIIRVVREALASDRIVSLRGILNGTSNYVLSRMQEGKLDFDSALLEAQGKGYAEADPTLDVDGSDAAHKLTILAKLAFGAKLLPAQVAKEGIDHVRAVDMHFADRFGYVVKPLAVARTTGDGKLDLRVHPALVSKRSVLAGISGALNAVYLEGAMLGPCLLSALGAGALPTAMSVVSDIVDVGRNVLSRSHGRVPSRAIHEDAPRTFLIDDIGNLSTRYYLRFSVRDRPGVLARTAGVLGAFDVSIEQMVQEGRAEESDAPVSVVMLTHEALEKNVREALREIDVLSHVVEPTRALRIDTI